MIINVVEKNIFKKLFGILCRRRKNHRIVIKKNKKLIAKHITKNEFDNKATEKQHLI